MNQPKPWQTSPPGHEAHPDQATVAIGRRPTRVAVPYISMPRPKMSLLTSLQLHSSAPHSSAALGQAPHPMRHQSSSPPPPRAGLCLDLTPTTVSVFSACISVCLVRCPTVTSWPRSPSVMASTYSSFPAPPLL
jgi:hypothetical protein